MKDNAILIPTPFNTEKYLENLCQRVSITLGQRSCNDQNYAIGVICESVLYALLGLILNVHLLSFPFSMTQTVSTNVHILPEHTLISPCASSSMFSGFRSR